MAVTALPAVEPHFPDYTLDGFADFCSRLKLEDRSPMVLEPFQREMLEPYFAGVIETVVLLPKKNGKTALLAALALYHVLTVEDADVGVVASSQGQAMKIFMAARGFVRRSRLSVETGGQLSVLHGYKEIRRVTGESTAKDWDGLIKVYAYDADLFDGWIGTLGVVDEYHRHASEETYGLMRDGLPPRDGQMVTISTAGDNEISPLGKLRKQAYALTGFQREGKHRFVTAPDFAFHEWALEESDDVNDLEVVKEANPLSNQTIAKLAQRKNSPSMRPWQWARFGCGLWAAGEHSAISSKEWHDCADEAIEIPPGAEGVITGCDLSQKEDTSAFVPVWQREDGKTVVHTPTVLTPPGDGTSLMFDDMFEVVREMSERWPKMTVVLDPLAGGEYLAQMIDRDLPTVRVATHSQAHGPMCLASERLATAIAQRELVHPDDSVLNAHVLGAGVRHVSEKWRFAKPKGRDVKIDAVIALSMAHSVLVADAQEQEHTLVGFS